MTKSAREHELELIARRLTAHLDEMMITVERSLSQHQNNATAMFSRSKTVIADARKIFAKPGPKKK